MIFLGSVIGLCLYYYEDDSFSTFSFDSFGQRMITRDYYGIRARREATGDRVSN